MALSGISLPHGTRLPGDRPRLAIALIGDHHHGKSTLLSALTRLFALRGWGAYVPMERIDTTHEERYHGRSARLCHALGRLPRCVYTLIDCPGHRDYVMTTVRGITQADAAIFVVSGRDGLTERAREHLHLAVHLGLREFVVFVSHCDVAGDEDDELLALIEIETRELLISLNVDGDSVLFVRGSGYRALRSLGKSDNADHPSARALHRLLDACEAAFSSRAPAAGASLLIDVGQAGTHEDQSGVTVSGRIARGAVARGERVELVTRAGSVVGTVRSIRVAGQPVNRALAGDFAALELPGLSSHDRDVHVACAPGTVPVCRVARAQLQVLRRPREERPDPLDGAAAVLCARQMTAPCTVHVEGIAAGIGPGESGSIVLVTEGETDMVATPGTPFVLVHRRWAFAFGHVVAADDAELAQYARDRRW